MHAARLRMGQRKGGIAKGGQRALGCAHECVVMVVMGRQVVVV